MVELSLSRRICRLSGYASEIYQANILENLEFEMKRLQQVRYPSYSHDLT
jgi:hypothetical protein